LGTDSHTPCYRLLHYEEDKVTPFLHQGLFFKMLLDSSTF